MLLGTQRFFRYDRCFTMVLCERKYLQNLYGRVHYSGSQKRGYRPINK
jgi:hypothetical protein